MAYNNQDFTKMPFENRVEELHKFSHTYPHEYVEYAQYYDGEKLWDRLQRALADDQEGVVIMRKDAPVYFKRTPARISLKIKKELRETIDCFFTGRALPPTREYTGKNPETWQYWVDSYTDERIPLGEHYYDVIMNNKPYTAVTKPFYLNYAGSLEIGVMNGDVIKPIGYLSGLSEDIKMNYKSYQYKVIEVGAMQWTPDHALRHGKMVGWRPDKNYKECTVEQIK